MVNFNLTDIGTSTEISSAKLELYVTAQPRTGSADAELYAVTKEWVESEATWNKANSSDWWDTEGGDYNSQQIDVCPIPSNAARKWEEWDVTSAVQDFIENPETNYGFHVKMSVAMVTIDYVSSEANSQSDRPKLTIDGDFVGNVINDVSKQKEQIKLNRTPESYMVYVPFSGNSTISIYNVNGKLLTTFLASQSNQWYTVPVSIKPGIHIIRINNNENTFIKKLWFVK